MDLNNRMNQINIDRQDDQYYVVDMLFGCEKTCLEVSFFGPPKKIFGIFKKDNLLKRVLIKETQSAKISKEIIGKTEYFLVKEIKK